MSESSASPELLPESSDVAAGVRMVVFDFDGVFTDNAVWSDAHGGEWVRCSRGDGLGLRKLEQLGIRLWVLSTEVHQVVSRRCEKLQISCRQGLPDKRQELEKLAAELQVALGQVVYVGNDINDLGCLRAAGIPIVVNDAHPDVYADARYRTRLPGGHGAVREVCDWIARSRPDGSNAKVSG
jgi:3-deoxy-D-manno-octulosonate 8-phosphate phosphatase (KDO 8-P phosphatase)